jgi:hypothetical protein
VDVPAQPRVVRLVEHRQPDLGEVDQLDVEPAVRLGELLHPAGDGDAPATGAGAGGDDLQNGTRHESSSGKIG